MLKELLENANNDFERWGYIIQYKHLVNCIRLDNDVTYIDLGWCESSQEVVWFKLNKSIGNSRGLYDLFDALGITSEPV